MAFDVSHGATHAGSAQPLPFFSFSVLERYASAAPATPPAAASIEQLLSEGATRVGPCLLTLNPVCDCVIGTDADGSDAVVGYSADLSGCRAAVRWAERRIQSAALGASGVHANQA